MSDAREHYERLLGSVYAWISGGADVAIERQRAALRRLGLDRERRGVALDLGAGFGAQSIPLAELGFEVVAVDFCRELLHQLRAKAVHLPIRCVESDFRSFLAGFDERAALVLCAGDTLTHLATRSDVRELFEQTFDALSPRGLLVLSFRDYVSRELDGPARFIRVRSDERTIFTCFLERRGEQMLVHDILQRFENGEWSLEISAYPKLRLAREQVVAELRELGFEIERDELENGVITLVARKL